MTREQRRQELIDMDEIALTDLAIAAGVYDPSFNHTEMVEAILAVEPELPGFGDEEGEQGEQ